VAQAAVGRVGRICRLGAWYDLSGDFVDAAEGNEISITICRTFSDCTTAPRKVTSAAIRWTATTRVPNWLAVESAKQRDEINSIVPRQDLAAKCRHRGGAPAVDADGNRGRSFSESSARHASRGVDECVNMTRVRQLFDEKKNSTCALDRRRWAKMCHLWPERTLKAAGRHCCAVPKADGRYCRTWRSRLCSRQAGCTENLRRRRRRLTKRVPGYPARWR